MNSDLFNYVSQSRAAGVTDEQIRQALLSSGWSSSDIDEALISDLSSTNYHPATVSIGSRRKKIIFILSSLLPLLFIGFVAFAYYSGIWPFYSNALSVISASYNKFSKVSSFEAKYQPPAPASGSFNFNVNFNFHKQGGLKIDFVVNNISGDFAGNLVISLIANTADAYLSFNHSNISDVIKKVGIKYPGLTETNSFKILQPIFFNEKWLHIQNYKEEISKQMQGSVSPSPSPSPSPSLSPVFSFDIKKLFIVKEYNRNYTENGENFIKIILGVDKNSLVSLLEELKNTDTTMKISQVNQAIETVKNTDGWDSDILNILIEPKTSYLHSIELAVPNQFTKSILSLTDSNASGADRNQHPFNVNKMLAFLGNNFLFASVANTNSTMVPIGKILFENYNSAEAISIPTDYIEFSNVMPVVIKDLPVLLQIMMQSQQNMAFNNSAQDVKVTWGDGKYQDALTKSQALIKDAKTNEEMAVAYYWRGLSYYKLGNIDLAEKDQLQALKLDPTNGAPYVNLAAVSLDRNKCNQALQYAIKAKNWDPQYSWAYNSLGLSYACLGQKEQAISALQKAVELQPDSYVFRDNLNRVKQSFGE